MSLRTLLILLFVLFSGPRFLGANDLLPSQEGLELRIKRAEEDAKRTHFAFYWHDLGTLYREAKRWEDAIKAETQSIEEFARNAKTYSKQALEFHGSEYPYGYYGRAKAWMAKKDFKAALKDFSKAIQLWERKHGVEYYVTEEYPKEEYVDSYRTRGMAWANEGDYGKGVDDLSIAIKLRKNDPILYYERAYLEEKAGHPEKAAESYLKSGLLYLDSGNKSKAQEYVKKLSELGNAQKSRELENRIKEKEPLSDLP